MIYVLSRREVETFCADPEMAPTPIISIRSPGARENRLGTGNWVLPLVFCDAVPGLDGTPQIRPHAAGEEVLRNYRSIELFEPFHARAIEAFVRLHLREGRDIIVHCLGGISRSAGVAAALQEFFDLPVEWGSSITDPNPHVKAVLLAVLAEETARRERVAA